MDDEPMIRVDELSTTIRLWNDTVRSSLRRKKTTETKKTIDAYKGEPLKSLRMLKTYRRPVTRRELPRRLRCSHEKFSVDRTLTERMAKYIAIDVLGLDVQTSSDHPRTSAYRIKDVLESYRLTDDMRSRMSPGNIHDLLRKCKRFCDAYERLIRDHIAPHIASAFAEEGRCEQQSLTVLFQFPPTLRLYQSHLPQIRGRQGEGNVIEGVSLSEEQRQYRSLGRFHCDAHYGHQNGEINFWMPLTSVDLSSTLYAEASPNSGEWIAFAPMSPGDVMRFHGVSCRHFTKPNISGKTRVSIDFRCSTKGCFDSTWRLPGISHRHTMRDCAIEIPI